MATAPVELLKRVPLLSTLQERDLEALSGRMKSHTFRAGTAIATAGQGGVGFFVVEDGTASVKVGDQVVGSVGPGDHFGEIALIDGEARTASVIADTELRCYVLTAWEFRPFVREHPDLAWELLKVLARRVREADSRSR